MGLRTKTKPTKSALTRVGWRKKSEKTNAQASTKKSENSSTFTWVRSSGAEVKTKPAKVRRHGSDRVGWRKKSKKTNTDKH